ncbi:MAG: hypothetical protein N0E48_07105 [Candidatus Thiodiazotropha endolucinida]|nr:hypothetical protein [Candidatus Thiodiazotropha taylori]MCW4343112.1 hypothetical protein [Candidatus Thiodiazotropha endolucinida]
MVGILGVLISNALLQAFAAFPHGRRFHTISIGDRCGVTSAASGALGRLLLLTKCFGLHNRFLVVLGVFGKAVLIRSDHAVPILWISVVELAIPMLFLFIGQGRLVRAKALVIPAGLAVFVIPSVSAYGGDPGFELPAKLGGIISLWFELIHFTHYLSNTQVVQRLDITLGHTMPLGKPCGNIIHPGVNRQVQRILRRLQSLLRRCPHFQDQ